MELEREEVCVYYKMNNRKYLAWIYYKVGKQASPQMQVSYAYMKDGEPRFTPWKYFLDIDPFNDLLIEKYNQRTILNNEIVFDYDNGEIDELLYNYIIPNKLNYVAYQTEESRSKRVHVYWDKLVLMKKNQRELFREFIIRKFNSDVQLKSDRHMCSFGYHFKTNKKIILYKTNLKGDFFDY